MSKEIPSDVKAYIRAVLLSAPKGVKQTQFQREYEKFANCKIEWKKLGFIDLYEFLLAIPDVARLEYSKKEAQNIIFGVNKKDIYASSHAKKAGTMKGTGAMPRHPSEWDKQPANTSSNKKRDKMTNQRTVDLSDDSSTVKVTVANSSDLMTGTLTPNGQGLFAVYIGDLPKDCTKEELEKVFREYPTMRLCKVVGRAQCGFAKFSTEQDALKALKEKHEYVLRGAKLKLRAAKEGHSSKSTENKTAAVQKFKDSRPKNGPKSPEHKNDMFNESELKQIYSRFGVIQKVEIHADRKTATLKFANQGEALITLKNLKERAIDGQLLVLSLQPSSESSLTVHMKENNSKDNSRPTSSASLSPGIRSGQESFFNFDDSSASQSAKQTLTDSTNQAGLIKTQPNLQPKPYQLHQQQTQLSRPEPLGFGSAAKSSNSILLEKNIHSFLTKEQMGKLFNDARHPLDQIFKGLSDEINVLVTEIVDACRFWAIVDNKCGNWQQLQDLEEHLQKTRITPTTAPQKFTIGAGRFTENNVWYRCFVLDVSADHKNIKVMYIDYGNIEWIPLERFSSLESPYLSLPPQANAFHLTGIELNYSNTPEKLKEGAQYLKHLIGDKTLIAKRKPPFNNNKPHITEVELFLKTPSDESINEMMLKTTYVTKESNMLKQDSAGVNSKFKLKISWVQSPTHIFYHLANKEAEKDLENLELGLKTIPEDKQVFPTIGTLVCMILRDFSRRRAIILDTKLQCGLIISVKLLCIDYGNMIKEVHPSKLLMLPYILGTTCVPAIAQEAFLEGLKLPPSRNIWPKQAMDVLMDARGQVLDGKIDRRQGQNYIVLYDSNGELLNEKILKTITEKPNSTEREARTIPLIPNTPTVPKLHIESMVTGNNNSVTNISGQTTLSLWPGTHDANAVVSQHQSNSQSQAPAVNAGFYMPPPPLDHKERPIPQGPHHVNTNPQEAQNNYHSPQGTQNVEYMPQGTHSVNNLSQKTQNVKFSPQGIHSENRLRQGTRNVDYSPQGTQNVIYSPQGVQSANTLPQGSHDVKYSPQGSHDAKYSPQMTQHGYRQPQEYQSGNRHPQRIQTFNNTTQGAQFQNYQTQGTQVTSSNIQKAQVENRIPQAAQVRHDLPQASQTMVRDGQVQSVNNVYSSNKVNGLPSKSNENKPTNSKSTPPQQVQTILKSVNGSFAQLDIQEDPWAKEREDLLAKRKEQEQSIERLSKVEQVNNTPNLQELKVKLAKQVRIKELENQVLKLKKEVESLEASKAKLQLHLMNT